MFHRIAAQEDERAGVGRDIDSFGVINAQGTAIGFVPCCVQIPGDHPLISGEELISMAPIEGSRREDSAMDFEFDETEERRFVERLSQAADLSPVDVLNGRRRAFIPPEDQVVAHILVDLIFRTALDAGRSESSLTPQAIGFFGQFAEDPQWQEVRRDGPALLGQLITAQSSKANRSSAGRVEVPSLSLTAMHRDV